MGVELNLSSKSLKKILKPSSEESQVINSLLLDHNELTKLDNIDAFPKLEKLSVTYNQLLRMYGVCRLHLLNFLDVSHNGILTIEGLRDLIHLKYLNLSGNNIKTIEHLNTNISLEKLDLSNNSIMHVADISFLKNLKELHLQGNRLTHLRQCDKFLPTSIETLSLARNNIADLNEMCHIGHLENLISFSIEGNPCVSMTGNNVGFDYRPFIINWIMSLKEIDGYVINAIESLKAEWLYSQGRGRQFALGEQQALCRYLAATCPLSEQALETEDHRKLRLILSKAQHHQQQLRDQMSSSTGSICSSPSPASARRLNKMNSPKLASPRLGARSKSPNRMISSYHGNNTTVASVDHNIIALSNSNMNIMTQSLDSAMILSNSSALSPDISKVDELNDHICENKQVVVVERTDINLGNPLHAATKLVPVPESLMSPDVQPIQTGRSGLQTDLINQNISHYNTKSNIPKTASPKGSPKMPRNSQIKQNTAKSIKSVQNGVQSLRNSPSPGRQRKVIPKVNPKSNNEGESIVAAAAAAPHASSDDESAVIHADKLQTIRHRALVIRQQKQENNCNEAAIGPFEIKPDLNKCAVIIQKNWRGFRTRKLGESKHLSRTLQDHRVREYIEQLTSDMAATKSALESERKIQQLQMQAISALWKKVSHLPSAPSANGDFVDNITPTPGKSGDCVVEINGDKNKPIKELEQTCTILQNQVRDLQCSMNQVMKYMSVLCQTPVVNQITRQCETATQTEIVAVNTPQEDRNVFPFNGKLLRPSTLSLPTSQQTQTTSDHNKTIHTQTVSPTVENKEQKEESLNDDVADVITSVN